MGKKSKRQQSTAKGTANRREVIQARRQPREVIQARRQPKDPRTEANELREEFIRLSGSDQFSTQNQRKREDTLLKYNWLMSDKLGQHDHKAKNFATKEDCSFIMGIYRDTQEVPLLRAAAVALWGEVSFSKCEERDPCLCMQLALKILNQSIESGPSIARLRLQEMCLNNLHSWRNANGENGPRRSILSGDICDSCGKLVQEYGVDFLACCGRCKLSYYCSVECQKKDWKEGGGHKERCRKKGEFLTGDTANYANATGPVSFDTLVLVLSPIHSNGNGKPDKWLVFHRDYLGVVLAQNLRRVRSAKWWSFEEHWNKMRALKAMMELVATDGSKCSTSTSTSTVD